jgi:DNA (cytosine-5)-methyltransferase 1
MTKFKEWPDANIDVLVGGTPCQSFSVAGLRKGLADPRGNLMLTYLAIAERYAPRWLVWENVPGVLSSNGGRDFGTLLGGLAELGYGFAYRVLDAQFFGVAQRRRRVFVVGHLGDWRRAATVLFERESLLGHPAPRRETGKGVAPTLSARTKGGGGLGTDFECDGGLIPGVARALTTSNQRIDAETETLLVAHSLRGEGFDASEDGTGRGTPLVPVHAFDARQADVLQYGPITGPMDTGIPGPAALIADQVRRLTPRECERLQGFPDDYTLINYRGKPAADGPRYKALGNSMAVPVMQWIGSRIQLADPIRAAREAIE